MNNYRGLPKVSAAFVQGEQIPMMQNQYALSQLQGLLAVQGALDQRSQAQARRNDIAEFEASLPPAERLRFRVDPAGYLKNTRPDPRQQAGMQLASLLASGGFSGVPGQEGPVARPDAVAMTDQEAIAKLVAAGDTPTRVDVPNPNTVRGLSVIAESDRAIPEILRQQRPTPQKPTEVSPLARLMSERDALPAGDPRRAAYDSYIEKLSTRAPEAPKAAEPLVAIKGEDGKPVYVPRSQALGKTPASLSGREDDHMTRRIMQFGQVMEKAGFAESYAVLDEAAKFVNQDTAKYLSGPKSYIPDAVLDKTVKDARQSLSRLFNITLKDRSGAAVTIPEFERLKKEFGTGLWNTPDQVMEGLRQARAVLDKHYSSVAAGFPAEVRDKYFESMNTVAPFGRAPAPTQSGWGIRQIP